MRLLLDTHTFLLFILDDRNLSETAKTSIENPENEVNISPASYWEIAIKIGFGKYSLPGSYLQFIQSQISVNDIKVIPIELKHTALLTSMP